MGGPQDAGHGPASRPLASLAMDPIDDPQDTVPGNPVPPGAQRRRPRRAATTLEQVPWRRLINPFRPVEILSADQVEAIHRTSLRILAEVGFDVLGDRVLDAFEGAGARVDRLERRVRLDPEPRRGADRDHRARVPSARPQPGARRRSSARVTSSSARWVDRRSSRTSSRGRRPGNFADLRGLRPGHRVASTSSTRRAADRSSPRTCRSPRAIWTCTARSPANSTRPGSASVSGRRRWTTRSRSRALIRGIDREQLVREPSCMTVINTNSPAPARRPDGRRPDRDGRSTASRSWPRRSRWPAR